MANNIDDDLKYFNKQYEEWKELEYNLKMSMMSALYAKQLFEQVEKINKTLSVPFICNDEYMQDKVNFIIEKKAKLIDKIINNLGKFFNHNDDQLFSSYYGVEFKGVEDKLNKLSADFSGSVLAINSKPDISLLLSDFKSIVNTFPSVLVSKSDKITLLAYLKEFHGECVLESVDIEEVKDKVMERKSVPTLLVFNMLFAVLFAACLSLASINLSIPDTSLPSSTLIPNVPNFTLLVQDFSSIILGYIGNAGSISIIMIVIDVSKFSNNLNHYYPRAKNTKNCVGFMKWSIIISIIIFFILSLMFMIIHSTSVGICQDELTSIDCFSNCSTSTSFQNLPLKKHHVPNRPILDPLIENQLDNTLMDMDQEINQVKVPLKISEFDSTMMNDNNQENSDNNQEKREKRRNQVENIIINNCTAVCKDAVNSNTFKDECKILTGMIIALRIAFFFGFTFLLIIYLVIRFFVFKESKKIFPLPTTTTTKLTPAEEK